MIPESRRTIGARWRALKVQHKVDAVLVLLLIPLSGVLALHLYLVSLLLAVQHDRHSQISAREQVQIVRRVAIDIEDAFHGYVLTVKKEFLTPLYEAEAKLQELEQEIDHLRGRGIALDDLRALLPGLKQQLRSKHELIADIESGRQDHALSYIKSGQGLVLSDALRADLRTIEDRLDHDILQSNERAERLSTWTFTGLWIAITAVFVLWRVTSRIFVRSLTGPIARLEAAAKSFGSTADLDGVNEVLSRDGADGDELSMLTKSYHQMAIRISRHIRELETLEAIGREINTIGPDGLAGVLRRITDRAAELVQADVCLVLLRNEAMGCWIVEAASGGWDEPLRGSVMLWEEFPVSVEAFTTQQPAVGEHFRKDERLQVRRRNLMGDSMLSVPLMAHGGPFGVLAFLTEHPRSAEEWNVTLAMGLAQEAAVAISNARLYEAAQQKQHGLLHRLRQLEQLAEHLAHDLKAPGARMCELTRLFVQQYGDRVVDERAARWLKLMEQNGQDIVQRVEGILSVARIGIGEGCVVAVDAGHVLQDVLKAHAPEIDRLGASVRLPPAFPMVTCHGAYLR